MNMNIVQLIPDQSENVSPCLAEFDEDVGTTTDLWHIVVLTRYGSAQ